MSLGKFIATRRKYLKMTQQDLADKIHVSKSAIAKWETDGGTPDRDNLSNLAAALYVNINELYRLIDGNEPAVDSVNITNDVIHLLESYGYKVEKQ